MQRWVVICCLALLACAVFADVCPDRRRCEEGQTCCKHPSNGYECCPFDQAECCEDHVHCCPAGTICHVDKAGCVNASGSVPWAERTAAGQPRLSKSFRMIKSYTGEEDDNICPDQSRCPAEFSCLRALTKYGCCPLAQGIPCSDGKHCCPEGHSCSEDSRSCIKKDVVTTVLCSDGISECPDESTCCEGADGQFGCCPMPQAVCCEDKTHCCPEGTSCDLGNSKCISTSTKKELPMWAKFPARRRAEWENRKEEQRVTSETARGEVKEKSLVPTAAPVTVAKLGERASNITCDSTHTCPDLTTCCSDGQGGFGCCPEPNAVCCSDHQHCCSSGTTCDLVHGQCVDDLDLTTAAPALTVWSLVQDEQTVTETEEEKEDSEDDEDYEDEDDDDDDGEGRVHCNRQISCPRNTTCCRIGRRRWNCCPLPHAVCCSDGKHCCPHHHKCNNSNQACVRSDDVMFPWYTKLPAVSSLQSRVSKTAAKPGERVSNVTCDQTTACPDLTTCCSDGQGGWGCCPEPNAVCCSDHQHCCPSGTTCDLVQQKCVDASDSTTPMSPRTAAVTTAAPATTEESQVPTASTETEEEEEDDEDYKDDDEDEDEEGRVHCKRHTTCPRNTTCCRFGRRRWGCCPLPHAVCCSDGKHCCPHHHRCNHSHHGCVRDDDVMIPWYTKLPALSSVQPQVSKTAAKPDERACNVTCDQTTACPDLTTCCSDGQGGWGCCPEPNAVCCSDHQHCCPSGTTCDLVHGQCVDASDSTTPMSPRTAAVTTAAPATTEESQVPTASTETEEEDSEEEEEDSEEEEEDSEEEGEEDEEDLVRCDRHTSCPRGSTCCRLGHKWGCCPLPHAVCCSDGKHCCPHHHKCSHSRKACVRDDDVVIPWYTKVPAVSSLEMDSDTDYMKCRDGKRCPAYNTCCLLSSGEYGCCPMENAVCCSDKKHCCPSGYACDTATEACEKSIVLEVEFVPLTPAKTETVEENKVPCGGSYCPDTFTCCQIQDMSFCCPYKNGVCCSERMKCCPPGQRCGHFGQCSKNSVVPWADWPFFRREEKNPFIL